MNNTVRYEGSECNLGRFGPVRRGDILVMTDQEFVMTQRDPVDAKRFVPFSGEWKPLVFEKRVASKDATSEEKKEVLEWNAAEEKRINDLNKANSTETVQREDLRSKSKDDLLKVIQILEGQGVKITLPQNPTKAQLVDAIEAHNAREAKNASDATKK